MPHIRQTRTDSAEIERPICAVCGSQMWLRKITKNTSDTEARLFECPVCEVSTGECDRQH